MTLNQITTIVPRKKVEKRNIHIELSMLSCVSLIYVKLFLEVDLSVLFGAI